MLDDPAVLLGHARQEAGNVLKGHNRNIERVTESDEAGALHRAVDMQDAGEDGGLVRDDADRAPTQVSEADDDVLGVVGVHLVEAARIHDA